MTARLVSASAVVGPEGIRGDALLLDGATIVAVGPRASLERPGIPHESFPGATVVPGLIDAHLHPVSYAGYLHSAGFKSARDVADVRDRVAAAAARLPPGTPVTGMRLDDESLAERRLPDRTDLDRAAPDHPVLLHRYCGHVAVANTAALAIAGIDRTTPDPSGGSFDRTDEGDPTGVLRETAIGSVAIPLARHAPPALTPDNVLDALHALAGAGITAVGAIAGLGDGPWAVFGNEADALAAVADRSPIRIGVFVIAATPAALQAAAARLEAAGPRVEFLGVKIFADGSLGGHTAAMHAPFTDAPGAIGTLRLDPERDRLLAETALEMNGRVAVHAIGDRANAAVIDLFAELIRAGADPARLRVEHASVLDPGDINRLADLGIAAVIQPAFLDSEAAWLEKRLGPRIRNTYPFRSLLDAGVILAGSSDCPVEPPFPLAGMAAARDRAGVMPAESLDARHALGLFTSGAAQVNGWPEPLQPGSPADFTVLDRDPLRATPAELRDTAIIATWVDGQPVAAGAGMDPWKD